MEILTEKLDLYLIFHSIHNVMRAEELLLEAGIRIDMVPVPRKISSDCGMCLVCPAAEFEVVTRKLKEHSFTTEIKIFEKLDAMSGYRLQQTINCTKQKSSLTRG